MGKRFGIKDAMEYIKDSEYTHGVIVYGPPGQGKSTGVLKAFGDMHITFTRITGMTSARRLFDVLFENRDGWVYIDDLNKWDKDKVYILMQALDDKPVRYVEWNTMSTARLGITSFEFTGKIVITTNVPPWLDPVAHALQDRVINIRWNKTEEILQQFPEHLRPLVRLAGASWRMIHAYKSLGEKPFAEYLKSVVETRMVSKVAKAWLERHRLGMQPWDYIGISRTEFFRWLALAREYEMIREGDEIVLARALQ